MDNEFYVYGYIDPRTAEYIYVGKGMELRAYIHLKNCKNKLLRNKIKAIRAAGMQPNVVFFACDISEELAFELEKKFIAEYGRIVLGTGTLCNVSDGGEGSSGLVMSPEQRARVSAGTIRGMDNDEVRLKCTYWSGKTFTEQHKEKISVGVLKAYEDPEVRQRKIDAMNRPEVLEKISASSTGRKHSEYSKLKMSDSIKAALSAPEVREKLSAVWTGRKHSDESRLKMSHSARNKERMTCHHCGRTIVMQYYRTHHGDKCKMKP